MFEGILSFKYINCYLEKKYQWRKYKGHINKHLNKHSSENNVYIPTEMLNISPSKSSVIITQFYFSASLLTLEISRRESVKNKKCSLLFLLYQLKQHFRVGQNVASDFFFINRLPTSTWNPWIILFKNRNSFSIEILSQCKTY